MDILKQGFCSRCKFTFIPSENNCDLGFCPYCKKPFVDDDIEDLIKKGITLLKNGVNEHQTLAFYFFRCAAAAGSAEGCYKVGYAYYKGIGVAPLPEKVLPFLGEAMRGGNNKARILYHRLLEDGYPPEPIPLGPIPNPKPIIITTIVSELDEYRNAISGKQVKNRLSIAISKIKNQKSPLEECEDIDKEILEMAKSIQSFKVRGISDAVNRHLKRIDELIDLRGRLSPDSSKPIPDEQKILYGEERKLKRISILFKDEVDVINLEINELEAKVRMQEEKLSQIVMGTGDYIIQTNKTNQIRKKLKQKYKLLADHIEKLNELDNALLECEYFISSSLLLHKEKERYDTLLETIRNLYKLDKIINTVDAITNGSNT